MMRRAVPADADGVVTEHERHRQVHHGGEPQCRSHVIGKHKVGHTDRDDPAMGRHSVLHRAHGMLADAVVDIAAAMVLRRERCKLALVLGRALQIGCARNQLRNRFGQHIDDVA